MFVEELPPSAMRSQAVPVSRYMAAVSVEIKILPTIPKAGRLVNISELNIGVPF